MRSPARLINTVYLTRLVCNLRSIASAGTAPGFVVVGPPKTVTIPPDVVGMLVGPSGKSPHLEATCPDLCIIRLRPPGAKLGPSVGGTGTSAVSVAPTAGKLSTLSAPGAKHSEVHDST